MTYFVKVTRLKSTYYTIQNTVNTEMTHHNYKFITFCVVKVKQNTNKILYPVNVYSFTPAVTLQTHCTCGPARRAHTQKWL